MDQCKHGLPIEQRCVACMGEAMRLYPAIAPKPAAPKPQEIKEEGA
ncbi:MAG: hypothetical protein ACRYG5_06630 [Janthinobacterium lividum]